MKQKLIVLISILILALSTRVQAQEEQHAAEKESDLRIAIYPVLWQAPIYGAEVNLPSVPGDGGGEPGVDRSSDYGLESAFLAGLSIEGDKWFLEFEAEYAGLSGERESPRLKISTDAFFFRTMGGWKFYNDFAVTGGVKRLSLEITAELGDNFKASTKPGLWDPMIGIDWRRMMGRKLQVNAAFEGGGFGVGTDVDLSGHVDVDWEVLPHFVLNAGYGFFYFKATVARVRVGAIDREFVTRQTLHGPRFGLGIVF